MTQNLAERKFDLVTDKKENNNNKPRVDYEPRPAHGRAVKQKNKPRVDYEPRLAHGRAVNNSKPRVEHEPRSAHDR